MSRIIMEMIVFSKSMKELIRCGNSNNNNNNTITNIMVLIIIITTITITIIIIITNESDLSVGSTY